MILWLYGWDMVKDEIYDIQWCWRRVTQIDLFKLCLSLWGFICLYTCMGLRNGLGVCLHLGHVLGSQDLSLHYW